MPIAFKHTLRLGAAAFCLCALCLAAPAQAAQRGQSTMPLAAPGQKQAQKVPQAGTSAAHAQKGARAGAAKAGPPKAAAGARAPQAAVAGQSSGIKGFSSNPFGLDYRDPPDASKKPDRGRLVYGARQDAVKPLIFGDKQNVTFSSKQQEKAQDRLQPRRSVFSGSEETLSRMDVDDTPEVSMDYKMNEHATTSLSVNPRDEGSPLPRPAEPDGPVNAAGVYMKVDVAPDVQMKVGGEYCDINDPRASSSDNSAGASVGLKWSF